MLGEKKKKNSVLNFGFWYTQCIPNFDRETHSFITANGTTKTFAIKIAFSLFPNEEDEIKQKSSS